MLILSRYDKDGDSLALTMDLKGAFISPAKPWASQNLHRQPRRPKVEVRRVIVLGPSV